MSSAYEVFQPYQYGNDFELNSSFPDNQLLAAFESTPLRSLSLADFGRYPCKALTTWGNDRHFRHFLPRMLELLLDDPYDDLWHHEVFLGKLSYARWWDWSPAEQRATGSILELVWRQIIATPPRYDRDDISDSFLCALSNARMSLEAPLADWLNENTIESVRQLAAFVDLNLEDVRDKNRLFNSFWDRSSAGYQVTLSWITSGPVAKRLLERHDYLTADQQFAAIQLEALAE
ncbi:hypothetical protein [Botrimarina colliarenosi]|uniref:hypothetical protein n=1 Tax=Botrimarina colliarenosi TaxID=2528001 RepID=UPI0011B57FB9|nr:hypothetical protein [Botrimarina colliarenosi]